MQDSKKGGQEGLGVSPAIFENLTKIPNVNCSKRSLLPSRSGGKSRFSCTRFSSSA